MSDDPTWQQLLKRKEPERSLDEVIEAGRTVLVAGGAGR